MKSDKKTNKKKEKERKVEKSDKLIRKIMV